MWEELLAEEDSLVLPWAGGRQIFYKERTWNLAKRPVEYGWYEFRVASDRRAEIIDQVEEDAYTYKAQNSLWVTEGFIVGDRLIPNDARPGSIKELVTQTSTVHLIEPGMDRISKAAIAKLPNDQFIFLHRVFGEGPEDEVILAWQEKQSSISNIKGVSPALHTAFLWAVYQRQQEEEAERKYQKWVAEQERKRIQAEKREEALKNIGTGLGRRALAQAGDFRTAASAALAISGAELLDVIQDRQNTMRVQYRFRKRRLECVVDKYTLRIVDAGVCLDDHHGTKGDTLLTLESLPPVINEAMNKDKLVVWRHI